MASEYYGLNRGASDNEALVTKGTSTGSTDVELRVDLTKSLTKLEVIEITKTLLRHITSASTDTAIGL